MISQKDKSRIEEINTMITELIQEKETLNPYSNLHAYSNKKFGEGWSEPHILENCPVFEKHDAKGYDFYCEALDRVEVKSCRLPATTVNQLHPQECDYFLFVFYDCENVEDYIYLIPSNKIMEFKPTPQHDRGASGCYNMSLGTKVRQKLLLDYKVNSYKMLNKIASGELEWQK